MAEATVAACACNGAQPLLYCCVGCDRFRCLTCDAVWDLDQPSYKPVGKTCTDCDAAWRAQHGYPPRPTSKE